MASGPTCRAKRPNTWLHRPMLHTFKKVLANSEPSTHGGKADMPVCAAHVCLLTQSGPSMRHAAKPGREVRRAAPEINRGAVDLAGHQATIRDDHKTHRP